MLIRVQTVFLALTLILTGLFIKLPYSGFGGKKLVTVTEVVNPEIKDSAIQNTDSLMAETGSEALADSVVLADSEISGLDNQPLTRQVTRLKVVHLMLNFRGLQNLYDTDTVYNNTFALTALVIITGLLSLITIFLFNNRKLQMRLCVFNILLTLGILLAIVGYYLLFKAGIGLEKGMKVFDPHLRWTLIIPLVNVVLLFQAFRFIRRDDILIKSYERLR
ncbi:MAG: DUF4293 domain-containing protein [Bacteroidales bacterium]|nr:DUF4293 domain-containing protein [Bacteroidales bacterium]